MDQLDRLRLFVTVADKASFAEAARSLRVSPTAATRAIAALEAELGVQLLRRTTRSVGLTDEGAGYLERCRRAIAELDEAAQAIRGESAVPHGTLVVTAPVMFGRLHILPAVTRLLRAHPELDVRLTLTDRVVRLVEEGVDIAVRIAELADSALRATHITDVRWVVVASPAYLAARGVPASSIALWDHDLIAFDNFSLNNEWRFGSDGRDVIRFKPRLLTNSVDAAIEATVQGLGITRALSYQVSGHIKDGRLALLLDDIAPPPVPVHLVYQPSRQLSVNIRSFIAETRSHLKGRPSL